MVRTDARTTDLRMVEVDRAVAADAAGVALVLAGSAASESLPGGAQLLVGPPLRSSLGFAATVSVIDGDSTICRGRLRVVASPDGAEVRLALPTPADHASDVRRGAGRLLRRVASLAEERASAA